MPRIPKDHRGLAIADAFRTLLSLKHLYQSHELSLDFIKKIFAESERQSLDIHKYQRDQVRNRWKPLFGAETISVNDSTIGFTLPNIQTFCHTCKERQAFKSISGSERESWLKELDYVRLVPFQAFQLSFLCQNCQNTVVDFLVTREDLKLQLCGRSPIETLPAPDFIPGGQRLHFSNAIIAHHAGQTLAGLFLLRTFIEQFLISLKLPDMRERSTGEELGEAYKRTLPDDFKSRFPSLLEVYGALSEAMHSANADAALFENSMAKIQEHFEARKLFKLK